MKKILVSAILLVAMMGAFAQYWSLNEDGKTVRYTDEEQIFVFDFVLFEDRVVVAVGDKYDFQRDVEDVYFSVDLVYTRGGKGKVIDGLFVFMIRHEDLKRFLHGDGLVISIGSKGFGLYLEGLHKPEIYKLISEL